MLRKTSPFFFTLAVAAASIFFAWSSLAQTVEPWSLELTKPEPWTKSPTGGTKLVLRIQDPEGSFVTLAEEQKLSFKDSNGEDLLAEQAKILQHWEEEREKLAKQGRFIMSSAGETTFHAKKIRARDVKVDPGFLFSAQSLALPSKGSTLVSLEGELSYFIKGDEISQGQMQEAELLEGKAFDFGDVTLELIYVNQNKAPIQLSFTSNAVFETINILGESGELIAEISGSGSVNGVPTWYLFIEEEGFSLVDESGKPNLFSLQVSYRKNQKRRISINETFGIGGLAGN